MREMIEVVSIKYASDYAYFVRFSDGTKGKIDFSRYLKKGPVFTPPKNKKFFKSARIEGGTISWPNGADVAPETLHGLLRQALVAA